jgi:hypothetical protein
VVLQERREMGQSRLGPIRVELLRLGERRHGAVEVAEPELGLGAQHERVEVLVRVLADRHERVACGRGVADQERRLCQRDAQLVALGRLMHRLLQHPDRLRRLSGLD